MKTVVKQKIVKLKTKWRGVITLSYNTTVHFTMNKKLGWQQWGAPTEDLWVSKPIVEKIWQEYTEEQNNTDTTTTHQIKLSKMA